MSNTSIPSTSPLCWVCMRPPHIALAICGKCGKRFHDGSCGHVPEVKEYERADPDDLARGQWGGGIRIRKDRARAVCDVCIGRFPLDDKERLDLFKSIEISNDSIDRAKMLHESLAESERRTALRIEHHNDRIAQERRGLKALDDELSRLRRQWRTLHKLIDEYESLQERTIAALAVPPEAMSEQSMLLELRRRLDELFQQGSSLRRKQEEFRVRIDGHEREICRLSEELEELAVGKKNQRDYIESLSRSIALPPRDIKGSSQ